MWTQSNLLAEALNANLEAHQVASVLAARSFQGLHTRIRSADKIRRAADDRLFQDDPKLWVEAEQNYRTARAEYQQILKSAAARESAYQLCDRADATLPYLVGWATALPRRHKLPDMEVSALPLILGELTFRSHALRRQLDAGEETTSEIEQLSRLEDRIRAVVRSEVKSLSSVEDLSLDNLNATNALLRLPIPLGQTRRNLDATRQSILTDLLRRTKPRVLVPETDDAIDPSMAALFLIEKLPTDISGLQAQFSKWSDPEETLEWEKSIRAELRNRAEQASKTAP